MVQNEIILIYVTAPNTEIADKISECLLKERLVACTNLLSGVKSQYLWKDKIEVSTECILLLKSNQKHFEKISERIVELHPYEVPCILAWSIADGFAPFIDWIQTSTQIMKGTNDKSGTSKSDL